MHIAILTCTISLPGCGSLKEKRQRMGGLHERLGRNPAVAVCESGERSRHEASEWSFVVTALSRKEVESLCSDIENKLERSVDGRVMEVRREFL
ncbi:DUF503 domain-containing protein [Marinimicrobium agarilyticum]|uniref:DUF503 domain-containing protein n=1 Tax=Marinimicrobium agarilyticum TaxID=306546 RepID=UPI0004103ECA|nr:DUF503 domain-containing protein [Marinimicrobium agarilyticum]